MHSEKNKRKVEIELAPMVSKTDRTEFKERKQNQSPLVQERCGDCSP